MIAMFFPYEHSQMLCRENSIGLLKEYRALTGKQFGPAPLAENWPGGAPQFLATLRARIAELKAEKAAQEEQEEK